MYEYVMAPEQDVVISSRVRLSRNYEDLPFSPKLNQGYAEEVIERTTEAVFGTENGAAFTFLRMADLEEDARSRLVEHHLISYDLLKFVNRSAAMISSAGTVTVMLNGKSTKFPRPVMVRFHEFLKLTCLQIGRAHV